MTNMDVANGDTEVKKLTSSFGLPVVRERRGFASTTGATLDQFNLPIPIAFAGITVLREEVSSRLQVDYPRIDYRTDKYLGADPHSYLSTVQQNSLGP